jgi:hypothetical protein
MSSVGTSYLRSSGAGESIVEESAATDAEAETVELDAAGKQVGPGKQRWFRLAGGTQAAVSRRQQSRSLAICA